MDAVTAADRILDALLALPERRDRLAALPDAFTPPALGDHVRLAVL